MSAIDELKNRRSEGYLKKPEDKGMDSGENNSTSRIIKLSDEEQKAFAQANPGEDLACEVHGTLEEDGHFHVMSVGPMQGQGGQNDMMKQLAQRVTNTTMPSPS